MLADPEDHKTAATVATAAGRLLLGIREHLDHATDAGDVRCRADRRAHEFIVDALTRRHPGDAVLSEEGADDEARLRHRRVWIVDPLDGTREFGDAGRLDWAVHVALAIEGTPAAGAVALPARRMTLATSPAPATPPRRDGPVRMLVSRTRPPELAGPLAESLGAEVIPMGSAGAKAMAVVLGEADVFVHAGGQYEWDSAAPVAVAAAAGLHVSRIDGSELQYNKPNPWLPDLLICLPAFASTTLEALRQIDRAARA